MPKRDYYTVKPQGSRVVNFNFAGASLSLFAMTDKKDSDRAKRMFDQNPEYWFTELMQDTGQI